MFGTSNDPALKLSGAETWGFMLYLLFALEKHGPSLPTSWKTLREAGRQLEHIYTVMQDTGTVMPKNALQDPRGSHNRGCFGGGRVGRMGLVRGDPG
eukprot:5259096-Lingulodinium_polyedra.AAC.1